MINGALSFGSPFYPGRANLVHLWRERYIEAARQCDYWLDQFVRYGDDAARDAYFRADETCAKVARERDEVYSCPDAYPERRDQP